MKPRKELQDEPGQPRLLLLRDQAGLGEGFGSSGATFQGVSSRTCRVGGEEEEVVGWEEEKTGRKGAAHGYGSVGLGRRGKWAWADLEVLGRKCKQVGEGGVHS